MHKLIHLKHTLLSHHVCMHVFGIMYVMTFFLLRMQPPLPNATSEEKGWAPTPGGGAGEGGRVNTRQII